MSRLFLLLAVLSTLMGLGGAAGLFLVLSLGSACGWLLLGPKGHWL
jgi:hypothetical protein